MASPGYSSPYAVSSPDAASSPIANTNSPLDSPSSTPHRRPAPFDGIDDTTPVYVWGTNISVQDVKAIVLRFIRHFRDTHSAGQSHFGGKYMAAVHRIMELEGGESLDIDAHNVFDHDPDLYGKMVRYPLEVVAIFDIMLMDMVARINPDFVQHIQTRIYNLKSSACMRNINPSDIEKLVSMKGVTIWCSSIIPEVKEAFFWCLIYGHYSEPIMVDRGRINGLEELAKLPDIFDRLTKALALNIWELDDVKRGLLCQLFGGSALKLNTGATIRGDINILLVGDPGTSKSQILQYMHKLSPREICTSGRGSSVVGLAAYVAKDLETGKIVLESGALVLSDRGICCIDEFDKMSENARNMLHENETQFEQANAYTPSGSDSQSSF